MEGQPFNIQVFCRPNPFFRRQDDISDEQYENCLRIVDNQITVKDLEQDKTFTDIFKVCSPESTQADLYNKISSVICFADVLNGYNSTVIAYGQTGGGKTHTLVGGPVDDESKGIIPRVLETVFRSIEETSMQDPTREFAISVSCLCILHEEIIDLLSDNLTKELKVKQRESTGEVYVRGLTELVISSPQEGIGAYHRGSQNRFQLKKGSCKCNGCCQWVNRVHTLFYINVQQRNYTTDTITTGRILFADLSGSERQKKICCQLKNASMVGLATCALGNVIRSLAEKASNFKISHHVPYRDSKLTRLLQDSLGGTSRTAFVVCISTCAKDSAETLSTLRFMKRIGGVVNFVLAHQQEDLMVADCKSSGPSKECAKKRRISDEFSIKADAKTSQSTAAAAVFPVRAKLFENLELDSKEQMSMDEKGYSGYAVVHLKSGAK